MFGLFRKRKQETVKVKFRKLDPDAVIPTYAHPGDSGMDICSCEAKVVPPGVPTLVKTGISAEIPEGYEIQVRPRSGLSLRGVTAVLGTVDSGYRGEIGIIVCVLNGESRSSFTVIPGMRLAQLVVAPVVKAVPVVVHSISDSERGVRGFGSTGVLLECRNN